ncbi:MAG: LacI family DNA-binding transcriptional regulator [Armatimonadota bacterium]
MPIKTSAATQTKHEELTRTLREMAARMRPGERFPSQTELMRRYEVSDRTVLRSLEDLRQMGWIVRRHGVGTFVADPRTSEGNGTGSPVASPVQTQTIAALSTSFAAYYSHCISLLSGLAEDRGLSFVCHHARFPVQFEDALPLESLNPLGFVLFSYSLLPVARKLQERGHRVVVFGTPPADAFPDVPCVYGDQEQGGYLATKHLIDRGHRRIAFAYHEERYPHPLKERLRWRGHERALSEAERQGISLKASLISPAEFALLRDDSEQARIFFRRSDAPTGVVCWNDTEVLLLLKVLHRAGVRVPDDVSIIGYDALPDGDLALPALSTVEPFVANQLRATLDLLARPAPPVSTQSLVFQPALLLRETTAAPPTP